MSDLDGNPEYRDKAHDFYFLYVKLQELHLGNNQLREITPTHLEHLPSISVLDLRDNKVDKLPDEIAQLQTLERLDVTNNDLSG